MAKTMTAAKIERRRSNSRVSTNPDSFPRRLFLTARPHLLLKWFLLSRDRRAIPLP
jgi:hypothetical protein